MPIPIAHYAHTPINADVRYTVEVLTSCVTPQDREHLLGYLLALQRREHIQFFPPMLIAGTPGSGKTTLLENIGSVLNHSIRFTEVTAPLKRGEIAHLVARDGEVFFDDFPFGTDEEGTAQLTNGSSYSGPVVATFSKGMPSEGRDHLFIQTHAYHAQTEYPFPYCMAAAFCESIWRAYANAGAPYMPLIYKSFLTGEKTFDCAMHCARWALDQAKENK